MKKMSVLLILVAMLLVAVVANAVPVLIDRGVFTRNIPDQPPEYPMSNIPTPDWWPH